MKKIKCFVKYLEKENMPIFKGISSKALPTKAINYITNPKKAAVTTSLYLNDSQNYSTQFQETAARWGKCQNLDSRKYYHFKLSFAPEDNITVEKAHKIALKQAKYCFPNNQCVLSTHTDKAHIHTHIIVNSVAFNDGRMLHYDKNEYGKMKDHANRLAEEQGFSTVNFRKPSEVRRASAEVRLEIRGLETWKEQLRQVIDEAKAKTDNITDFESWLKKYGVALTRNTEKTIAYKHPEQKKSIRGEKLGDIYTKESIENAFTQHRNRNATQSERSTERTNEISRTDENINRKRLIERRISSISAELRGITASVHSRTSTGRAEQAEENRRAEEARQRELEQIKLEREQFEKSQRDIERNNGTKNREYEQEYDRGYSR